MPEQGRYEKVPRPESIEKFLAYLGSSNAVNDIQRESNQVIMVKRTKHTPIRVFMTNMYIVGLADVHEILHQVRKIDAIVTMSEWNGYTTEAKVFCKERGIGLFTFKEFLGAVYYDGDSYLNYIPQDKRAHR